MGREGREASHHAGKQRTDSCGLLYLCQCEVDPVSEWGDDQAAIESHVLVSIAKGAGTLTHHQLIGFLHPVEPQLAFPLKLASIQDATVGGRERKQQRKRRRGG